MTPLEALQILDDLAAQVTVNRADQLRLMEAAEVLHAALTAPPRNGDE